jgi:hypothetical protein
MIRVTAAEAASILGAKARSAKTLSRKKPSRAALSGSPLEALFADQQIYLRHVLYRRGTCRQG